MKVAVIGAGFGGWGAVKSLVEAGQDVVLIDTLPDPRGAHRLLRPQASHSKLAQRAFGRIILIYTECWQTWASRRMIFLRRVPTARSSLPTA